MRATPALFTILLAATAACQATPATTATPDSPGGYDWQVTPLAGPRWLVSPGHAYHAVDWTNGGSSRRTADLLGSFYEGPVLAVGANVVAVPPPGEGDFAPYGAFTWSFIELDSNRWDFNWTTYTLGGGVRWMFVHTQAANVYALSDLSVVHGIGEGEEQVFRGVRQFDLEAQDYTGWALGLGLGADLFPIDAFGLGVQAAYRYNRAGGIYYGALDGTLNLNFRF